MFKGGTLADFVGSMAEAIEQEFEALWSARYRTPLPEGMRDDRRLLFVAIAQGVIKHLRENAEEAFDVTVNVDQLPVGNLIVSGGTSETATRLGGRWTNHTHDVSVTQSAIPDDTSYNKVKSQGYGTVRILMEELDS